MANDTAQIIFPTTTCITGPLAQPIHDSFSMVVDVVKEQLYERVTVPGVCLSDPEFATGYYWGRSLYFNDVEAFVDQAGNSVERFTEAQLPLLNVLKVRDVTDQQVVEVMEDIMRPETPRELSLLDGLPTPPAFRAGLIFGYVHACIETAQEGQA